MRRLVFMVVVVGVAAALLAGCFPLFIRHWVAVESGCPYLGCGGKSVRVSPDGTTVYVAGTTTGNHEDYLTTAYKASDGTKLWAAFYDGPAQANDRPSKLEVSPDGTKVYVTGTSFDNTTAYDYATVAYDTSNGAQLWVARYAGPTIDDIPTSLAVSADGTKVFVTGQSHGTLPYEDFDDDYATVAYDASNGAQLWAKRYNNVTDAFSSDIARSIGVSPDGTKVFVTGESYSGTTEFDYATLAYNASDGTQLWLMRYNAGPTGNHNNEDYARSLGVSPDGTKVYVTGQSTDASTTSYATIAYNASTGAQVWLERYDGGGATSLVASRDGAKVYVTGQAGFAFTTVAYDASAGSQRWVTRYQASFVQPNGIVLSPDETKVYITGGEYNGALTQVYDASDGRGLGGNIYKGAIANDLAVSPDGSRLYVTGQNGQGNGITIAYNAVEFP